MPPLNSPILQKIDWGLVTITLLLGGIGILNLSSAALGSVSPAGPSIHLKQGIFLMIGVCFAVLAAALDYRRLLEYSYVFYVACVLLLATVLFLGKIISGSQRWISLGPVAFQPSELSKLAMLMVLARFFSKRPPLDNLFGIREALRPFGLIALPAILIVLEPDLGTAILLLLISVSLLVFAGFQMRSLLIIATLIVVALPLAWLGLEDYQRSRILSFVDPSRDPLGAGYHITQSKIAVGSGGLFGKGFRQGTQSQLHFLPERHTDFAFSVWAEEWGLIGALFLLCLFFFLLAYGMSVAYRAGDLEGRLLAFGVVAFFFWPIIINLGMTLGLVPVVGVALPFISYGGSSLITSMLAIGLLANVRLRRFKF
jgi:rod shape determining protein RodA